MGGTARVNEGGRPGSLTSWQNSITAKGYSSQQSYVKKPTGWLSTVRPPIDGSNLSHRLYVGTALICTTCNTHNLKYAKLLHTENKIRYGLKAKFLREQWSDFNLVEGPALNMLC